MCRNVEVNVTVPQWEVAASRDDVTNTRMWLSTAAKLALALPIRRSLSLLLMNFARRNRSERETSYVKQVHPPFILLLLAE